MRDAIAFGMLATGLTLAACDDSSLVDGLFTPAEWEKISLSSPLPPPPPSPTNKYADRLDAAAFGQRLWFERRYAGADPDGVTQNVSCSTCHDPAQWFSDARKEDNRTSVGTARTRRNAPAIVNVVYYEWGNWAGSHDQFWKQGANSPESKDNFNSSRLAYAHVIYTYYRDHYNALFGTDPESGPLPDALDPNHPEASRFPLTGKPRTDGTIGPWEAMDPNDREIVNRIMANCGKALEAYERLLVSGDSPFDRYVAGDLDALTPSAKRGLKLFIGKAGCVSCHSGETFTDQKFHNTGVPQSVLTDGITDNDGTADFGRHFDVTRLDNPWNGASKYSDDPAAGRAKLDSIETIQADSMKGEFRTKSLRHVAETGPYLHDGSLDTLTDVVRFYNRGGGPEGSYPGMKDERLVPLNLSDGEIADIVEFLRSLTGQPIPEHLKQNTSATNPVSHRLPDNART